MTFPGGPPPSARAPVEIVCDDCKKTATVPFQPTPGRPVYCRDCFPKHRDSGRSGPPGGGRGPPRGGGPGGGRPEGGFRGPPRGFAERPPPTPRKRMMKQGAKAHFLYDLNEVLKNSKMEEIQRRSFAETLFSKGARGSSEEAIAFANSKVAENMLTTRERDRIGELIQRYSMWR